MDERKAWDLFWSYDRLASFGTGQGAGNYGEAIAAGWRDFFTDLPSGSRVMDLATGNGAIAVMAVEAGDNLEVTGADLASVRPAAFVSKGKDALAKIRFLSDTPAEELLLEDGSFDAVVSQYGIEYSDLERSVPEAVRILAPGGRLRFACHAAEGSVAADTKRAIKDADFLLDEVDLTGHAATCIPAIVDVERGRAKGAFAQVEAQEKYRKFREALRLVAERARSAADADMLVSVHRTLTDLFQQRQSHSESEIGSKIAALRLEVEAHRERERALLGAALSADEMGEMAERLYALGLRQVRQSEQRNGSALIGHIIEAASVVG
jgi:SAM-dependent methyltransferase